MERNRADVGCGVKEWFVTIAVVSVLFVAALFVTRGVIVMDLDDLLPRLGAIMVAPVLAIAVAAALVLVLASIAAVVALRRAGVRVAHVQAEAAAQAPTTNLLQKILLYVIIIIPMAIVEALAQLRASGK